MFGSILEESGTVVDWSPIIEDLYSPELGFMDICATSVFHLLLQLLRVSDAPTPFTVHSS